ncbi:hypothetical protein ALNOE001_18570 [Candidatus Methanobinarius endosymbioticus]|uniref:Uncharacterized protein n=1 Tax=Candidatus Methanobinarius endosymbioticus TaxID=2006182 RepID=A0A366M8T1_9EURY|nr:hypothetical protein ALNOE001_18570 [Candidatus Methanobinarius endosymbioticus]
MEIIRKQQERQRQAQYDPLVNNRIYGSSVFGNMMNAMNANNRLARSANYNTGKTTLISTQKLIRPLDTTIGVVYALPNSKWAEGMKLRDMPNGSVTKFLHDTTVKYKITGPKIYGGLMHWVKLLMYMTILKEM